MRPYRPAAVCLALAACLALAPAFAQARAKRTCHPAHTKTLAASPLARVYETRKVVEHAHVTYGCLLSTKHPLRFDLPDFPLGYGPIALAGRFVAYGDYSDCAASFCDPNSVVVQDLRGRGKTYADGPISIANVFSLVLRADGSVAWISSAYDSNGSPVPGFAVVKAERGSAPVVLATGPDVLPGSLALAGTTLYWTKGGAAYSAPLN